jgi:putative ABC transport system permease protein
MAANAALAAKPAGSITECDQATEAKIMDTVRFAIRQFRRNPLLFTVVVLTLGIGIGASTTLFSAANAVLLRPLPFADSDRLLRLWSVDSEEPLNQQRVSYPDLVDWRAESQTLDLVGHGRLGSVLTGQGDPVRLRTELFLGDLFGLLRVPPMLGSVPAGAADQPVVVLSHGLWQSRFGGDAEIMGTAVTLDGTTYSVAAVMPRSFEFPVLATETVDAWIPLEQFNPALARQRGARLIEVIARMRPGVALDRARAEMDVIAASLGARYPDTNAGMGVRVTPALDEVTRDHARGILLLSGAVGVLLLIACVNVANLLLARSTVRGREFAIRSALGAGHARITRQLLVESVILSLLGGLLGCVLSVWGVDVLRTLLTGTLPRAAEIKLDLHVLGFAAVTSIAVGLSFGLVPAWNAWRLQETNSLQRGVSTASRGIRGRRLADVLVVTEVVLATVLLAAASAFIHSYWKLNQPDTAFDPERVLTFSVSWSATEYPDPGQAFTRLRSQLLTVPDVVDASTGIQLPDRGQATLDDTSPFLEIEGQAIPRAERQRVSTVTIQPGYFRTLGIPLLTGRDFSDDDRAERPPVVIVNESLVRAYLGGEDPIGRRLSLDSWTLPRESAAEIVGVVGDVGHRGLSGSVQPLIYLPISQRPVWNATVVVRTAGEPLASVPAIREAFRVIDPDQPIENVQTLDQRIAGTLVDDRSRALLLGSFAISAVLLAAIGLYGVLSYTTSQRAREIGIRMALGARADIVSLAIVSHGMRRVLLGTVVGVAASFGLGRLVDGFLFEVSPADPVSIAAVATTMFLVALLACAIPASRSARVDPVHVLRYE